MAGTKMEVTNAPLTEIDADWLIVPVPESVALPGSLGDLNEVLDGQLARLFEQEDLKGKRDEVVVLPDVPALSASRLLLVGFGKADTVDVVAWRRAMMNAAMKASTRKESSVAVVIPDVGTIPIELLAEVAATAMTVGGTGQAFHKAEPKRNPFTSQTYVVGGDPDLIGESVQRGIIIGDAINTTRELVNRPAGEIYPETFADQAEAMAEGLDLECTILTEDEMYEEAMGSLLAVAKGSDQEGRLVVLKYQGSGEGAPTIGLCGKGVTFDSGGLSLKPGPSMVAMKMDMAGAATVLGTMIAVARLKLPVNVIAVMGLVENMVSGSSYKLGDILTARNGTTIEVLNTDAEGRLVLADVLNYCSDLGADKLIDLATLTGACVVALGEDIVGAFTNDQEWCDQLVNASQEAGEMVWQMPMHEHFGELLDSEVADTKNVGPRWGGAVTAAKFLEKFVGDTPWVHLDIAGPAFAEAATSYREGGATGAMVRTLIQLLEQTGD